MNKEALQFQHAGFISRAIAFVLDLIVMSVAIFATIALTEAVLGFFTLYGLIGQRVVQSDLFRNLLFALIALASAGIAIGYPVGCWVLLGQTPGKMLTGVRIVRMDGQPLTVRRALLRFFGYWLSAIPLGIGFLWVLMDNQRQCWHDKLAGTCVVYDSRSPLARSRQTPPSLSQKLLA